MTGLISITTYLKNSALDAILASLIRYGYYEGNTIIVCDDNCLNKDNLGLTSLDIVKKYKNEAKIVLAYGGSPGQGVARNKNRGIKFFLDNKKYDSLLMCDDDIVFQASGLIEHLASIDYEKHITFRWYDQGTNNSSTLLGLKGQGWDKDFPIKGKDKEGKINYFLGCQGILLWFSERELVEKIGYVPVLKHAYGAEHSAYSSLAMLAQGRSPEMYPQLVNSHKWIMGQSIPNAYEIDMEKVRQNLAEHDKLIHLMKLGQYTSNPFSGLNKKLERIIK